MFFFYLPDVGKCSVAQETAFLLPKLKMCSWGLIIQWLM